VLRTGKDYIESLRDGREVWIDGEQVQDVPTHPAFAPVVNVRARIYDLAREAGTRDLHELPPCCRTPHLGGQGHSHQYLNMLEPG